MSEWISSFKPGAAGSGAFYHEAVRPVPDRRLPGLAPSAAKLHGGSDVPGLGTPQSVDHDWGTATFGLLLRSDDGDEFAEDIRRALARPQPTPWPAKVAACDRGSRTAHRLSGCSFSIEGRP